MRNYFILDGVDSRDFGVYISGQGTFNASARDYNMILVPGRNGDLVGPEKRFQNGTLVYPAFIYSNFDANIKAFRNFLLSLVGYHDLIDSYHPDEIRKVLFQGPFNADVVTKNDAGSFDIEFVCKPQRYLASGNEVTTFESTETETFSGSIVTFDNPGGATVNALSTAINPVQDLHGYANPWPAGGGKNLFDFDQTVGTTIIETASILLQPGTYYVYVAAKSPNFNSFVQISSDGTSFSNIGTDSSVLTAYADKTMVYNQKKCILTVVSATYCRQRLLINGNVQNARIAVMYTTDSTGYSSVPANMTYNSPEWQAVYRPYSNICPISGFSAANVTRTGVNAWDEEWELGSFNSNGQPSSSSTSIRCKNFIPVVPGQTYYMYSGSGRSNAPWMFGIDKSFLRRSSAYLVNQTFTVPEDVYYIKIALPATYGTTYNHDISINYPSTDHAYHAYAGNTYTIDLDGTRYGGTLDVLTGVLTVDKVGVDMGSVNWGKNTVTQGTLWRHKFDDMANAVSTIKADILCSLYPTVPQTQRAENTLSANNTNVDVIDSSYADAALFKTAVTGQTIVYPLATPITITLTPQAINSLVGENNLWSDTGNITATIVFPQDQFTITNPTRFDSQPLLRVWGTGQLGIGSQTVTITQADVYTDIDCEMMDAFKGTANKNPYVQLTDHNFPVFKPGVNNISLGTGITKVEITPRWWIV